MAEAPLVRGFALVSGVGDAARCVHSGRDAGPSIPGGLVSHTGPANAAL
jgi:hypothetical protein